MAVCALAALAAPACSREPAPPREITLVARGMSFVVPSESDEPNPTIAVQAGERIRLVLRNEAPGLLHDVEIPEWDIAIDQIRAGEQAEIMLVVPDRPGHYEYRCRPHAEMMSGVIDVAP